MIVEKESAEDIPSPWLFGTRFPKNLLDRHLALASEETPLPSPPLGLNRYDVGDVGFLSSLSLGFAITSFPWFL